MTVSVSVIQTAEDLLELQKVFGTTFEDPKKSSASLEYLKALSTKEGFVALGAYSEGRVVGGLTAYELPLIYGTTELYIYDIAVAVSHQRLGIGKQLIEVLKKYARERGISTIFVEAEAGDPGAVAFYRSLGVEELSVQHFNIEV